MFSATGLLAAIAVLTLAVSVATPADPSRLPAAASGATLVVAADGSGDHVTISAAVAAATDGDTILIQPGTYAESVTIDKDITLRGDGPVEDIVLTVDEVSSCS